MTWNRAKSASMLLVIGLLSPNLAIGDDSDDAVKLLAKSLKCQAQPRTGTNAAGEESTFYHVVEYRGDAKIFTVYDENHEVETSMQGEGRLQAKSTYSATFSALRASRKGTRVDVDCKDGGQCFKVVTTFCQADASECTMYKSGYQTLLCDSESAGNAVGAFELLASQ